MKIYMNIVIRESDSCGMTVNLDTNNNKQMFFNIKGILQVNRY